MKRPLAIALLLAPVAAIAATATVVQPRPYGYLVGDTFEQRVLLEIEGRACELPEPLAKDKLGVWLLRRGARFERDADAQRWLVLDYQVVNASKDLDRFTLPALKLRCRDGRLLETPDWPMTAGAIVQQHAGDDQGLPTMLDDQSPPRRDLAAPRRWLRGSLALLALSLGAWFGWWRWREWRAAQRLPFARALHELRRLGPETEAAWRCLHRAFDETAGLAMSRERLAQLYAAAPSLAPAREQIEQFFAASERRFFGGEHRPFAVLPALDLARRLRALERDAER